MGSQRLGWRTDKIADNNYWRHHRTHYTGQQREAGEAKDDRSSMKIWRIECVILLREDDAQSAEDTRLSHRE